MELFTINWFAVLVCVVFSMLNGSVWYNPGTFFTKWWKVVGGGKEKPGSSNMILTWTLTIVASAVKAIFVAVAVNAFAAALGGVSVVHGLITAAIVGVGFLAPTYLTNKLFAGHGLSIWLIEVGNHLIDVVAFAVLFSVWR